jgi:hypothetical protein
MSVQYIENNGTPEYAVIPVADYALLLEKYEMLGDRGYVRRRVR